MSLTCKVAASAWDAVAYVRNKIEDVPGAVVSDAALSSYIEGALEEFSRLEPLEDVVGNIASAPPSSPLQTVANQNHYVCSVGNGFTGNVMLVKDVLYRASGVFTAASEIAYLALMPISPLNWFRIDKDLLNSPSSRLIRDQYLQELDHYGIGYWRRTRDRASGLQAIDIYPPPMTAGLPIFVQYLTTYPILGDINVAPTIPQIPEDLKRQFGELLYAEVLDQEADRIAKTTNLKAGITQIATSPREIRQLAESVREQVFLKMNGATGVATVSW